VADKSTQLIVDALCRAVAEPDGLPLYGSRAVPGLFAATGPAKQAAQKCKDEGHLRLIRQETKGKAVREFYALSDKGVGYLLGQVSPRQVLGDLVRALEARQEQLDELTTIASQTQSSLEALRNVAAQALQAMGPAGTMDLNELHRRFHAQAPSANGSTARPAGDWLAAALACLIEWDRAGAREDYPLPDLYRKLQPAATELTIGQYHDGLRQLFDREQIYLHPWTGPLCEMPEPPLALLVGHEIAYYASIRK
jgi:hypothetical protein